MPAESIHAYATVCFIVGITPHPNADRLEVIHIADGSPGDPEPEVKAYPYGKTWSLVTGKHYRSGDFGVWLRPGAIIPGWLAHDLWMVGKKRSNEPFEVREIEIRGVASPGLWAGRWYRNDSSKESLLRVDEMAQGGGRVVDGWISWGRWDDSWKVGDHVDDALGVSCPSSSVVEHLLVKQEVADGQAADLGSTPAVGSTTQGNEVNNQ